MIPQDHPAESEKFCSLPYLKKTSDCENPTELYNNPHTYIFVTFALIIRGTNFDLKKPATQMLLPCKNTLVSLGEIIVHLN